LLYTAMTRGRKLVVIVGSKRALSTAVSSADTVTRVTGLARRLERLIARGDRV
jgi:exodeoxyribonuclease V alpha subunit